MKINNNCARKVLLEVEKIPSGETLTVEELQQRISEFTIEDVVFIVTLFNRERYLNVLDKASYDDHDVFRENKIKGLTEKGYKTLDLIRNDDVWNLIKGKMDDFDEISIFTIVNVANKIINVRHNELFGLPRELLIENTRW